MNLDFVKLYEYFKGKYPELKEVRYYEGIARGDKKKLRHFSFLEKKVGYKVCSLIRKGYVEPAKFEKFNCKECGAENTVRVLSSSLKLKSNVDVYMTADMLELAATSSQPIHFVLMTCDGDFVEAINSILRVSPGSRVTVIATPKTEKDNFLSSRLMVLANRQSKNTALVNIESIKDKISQPLKDEK